ncbi:ABC transporter ATP-binding protein [Planctobacterium marinum]|uniref:ABC transporter ATP-binding protein n=1 Tax=Planctobacterium marinum TaxID=1631968 RepID=A0AA48I7I3_9ALTE|nr:ABC transporter ATP-binding protein [Planctobacterium marinum]
MNHPLITLSNIKKVFFTDEIETHAISDLSLRINQGEYVSISGPSGCGKSTLLSILGLLDTATDGQYTLNEQQVVKLTKNQRAKIRNREIGFIFQSFNLISDLSVAENVELPLTYRDDLDTSTRKKMVQEALEKVDMSHRAKHFPAQLSGGQQQRVAIARAIAGSPSIILADEPTGNLDSKNAEIVMNLLDNLHQQGATICIVTHDPRSAEQAQRRIEMYDGKVVDDKITHSKQPTAA